MKELIELKDKIESFWDHEDDKERDAIIEKIKSYAGQTPVEQFIQTLQTNFQQNTTSGIAVIYEALSSKPSQWGGLFKAEYERAFLTAADSNDAFEILECLEEVSIDDPTQVAATEEIILLLSPYFIHPKDVLRYKSIWCITEWLCKENAAEHPTVVKGIVAALQDENWKIRFIAQEALVEIGKLPAGYKMSMMDKIKVKTANPYEIE